jgi:hypothetical protein
MHACKSLLGGLVGSGDRLRSLQKNAEIIFERDHGGITVSGSQNNHRGLVASCPMLLAFVDGGSDRFCFRLCRWLAASHKRVFQDPKNNTLRTTSAGMVRNG